MTSGGETTRGKRPGGKCLGGETIRGGNGYGAKTTRIPRNTWALNVGLAQTSL